MRAVVFQGVGKYGVQEMPKPEIGRDDDVIIRVAAVGICGTDLHIVSDPPGFPADVGTILGHEFCGVVAEAGDRAGGLRPGDRVVIEPNISCMNCAYCKRGLTNLCLHLGLTGLIRHGGLAEFCLMPARNVHRIPDSMPFDVAALTEPLACVMGGTDKVKLQPGETVVVLGGGPIGLLYLQVFKSAGARKVIVVEPQAVRAEYAQDLGADLVLDPNKEDVKARVLAETELGADVAVDAVGNQAVNAIGLVRRGGNVLVFGLNAHAEATLHQFDVTWNELTVRGSLISRFNFPQVINVLASGKVDARRMVTNRIGLDEVAQGVAELRSGRAIKVLVAPNGWD